MQAKNISDDVAGALRSLSAGFDQVIINSITQWIEEHVIPQARLDSPYRTGNLRENLRLVTVATGISEITFVVGWGDEAPYGRFQERGTRFMKAKKFVENSLRSKYPQLPPIWIAHVEQFSNQLHGLERTTINITI